MFNRHPGLAEPHTKEEWRDYVLTVPPSRPALPDLAEYRTLSPSDRASLDERRYDYHSALVIVQTPAMQSLHQRMRTTVLMNSNAPAGARRGHVIDGEPTLGKSTIVKTFGRDHERKLRTVYPDRFVVHHDDIPDDYVPRDYTPVVYISIPAAATPKMLSVQFAEYLGLPYRSRASATEITNSVLRSLRECETEIVIIDDIHFLDCSQKDGKLANDHLKYLANHCAATFLYAGVDVAHTSLLPEGTGDRGTQTAGRFSVLPVRPFAEKVPLPEGKMDDIARQQAKQWIGVVTELENALALYEHPTGSLAKQQWRYLLDRTSGRISSLSGLLRAAAIEAIEHGLEAIDKDLLDSIPTDWATQTAYEQRHETKKRAANKPLSVTPTTKELRNAPEASRAKSQRRPAAPASHPGDAQRSGTGRARRLEVVAAPSPKPATRRAASRGTRATKAAPLDRNG